MRRFGGAVVRHGTIGVERGNGRKAQRNETRTAGTCGAELLVDGQLSDGFLPQRGFQPSEKLTQRRTILLHGATDVSQVLRAFLRFGQRRRIETFDQAYFSRQMGDQPAGDPRRINQQTAACRHLCQGRLDRRIVAHLNTISRKHLAQRRIQLARRNKENCLILADQRKGDKYRIVGNIATTQIE
ncbi:hypothetical protein D3C78_1123210 [compost metagenome]